MLKPNTSSAYAISLAAVAVLIVARRLLDPWLGQDLPFITVFAAIGFAAAFAGRGPALLTVAVSVGLADSLLAEPFGTLAIGAQVNRYGLLVFAMSGTALALLVDSRQRVCARAIAHADPLQTTLASIGDAVVATDTSTIVAGMNAVAGRMTGWCRRDAIGGPHEEIFRIVAAATGEPAANPALRALQEGVEVGLANRTLLIAHDGRQ